MAIEAETADDESLEVAHQEIGQVERPGFLIGERRERRATGVDLIAVGALEAADALLIKHAIEQAARPAIGIGHEQPVVAVR